MSVLRRKGQSCDQILPAASAQARCWDLSGLQGLGRVVESSGQLNQLQFRAWSLQCQTGSFRNEATRDLSLCLGVGFGNFAWVRGVDLECGAGRVRGLDRGAQAPIPEPGKLTSEPWALDPKPFILGFQAFVGSVWA